MGNRNFQFEFNAFYHIYNRGLNKQKLFFEERDYNRFLANITRYRERFQNIHIFAYALLPNHFHLLLAEKSSHDQEFELYKDISSSSSNSDKQPQEFKLYKDVSSLSSNSDTTSISQFMQKIQQAYAMFFNAKYRETKKKGKKLPMFEGRFQARVIEKDLYLDQVKNYIEYNPVKHGLVDDPAEWVYSSFRDTEFELSKDNILNSSSNSSTPQKEFELSKDIQDSSSNSKLHPDDFDFFFD